MPSTLQRLDDGRLKVELTVGLETLWSWLAGLSLLGVIMFGGTWLALLAGFDPRIRPEYKPYLMAGSLGSIGCLAIAVLLMATTDNYLVFDLRRKEILSSHKFCCLPRRLKTVAAFNEIVCLAVKGACRRRKISARSWWEYSIVLVMSNAATRRISDWSVEEFEPYNQIGRELEQETGLPFVPGVEATEFTIDLDARTHDFVVNGQTLPSTASH